MESKVKLAQPLFVLGAMGGTIWYAAQDKLQWVVVWSTIAIVNAIWAARK